MIIVNFDTQEEYVWIRNIIDTGVLNGGFLEKIFNEHGIPTNMDVNYHYNKATSKENDSD